MPQSYPNKTAVAEVVDSLVRVAASRKHFMDVPDDFIAKHP
jgi:hypothetical protein